MFEFRGDAHRFYLKIKKSVKKGHSLSKLNEIDEIKKIRHFYQQFSSDDLLLIQYRMEKEKNGSGILPIFISSLPWLPFIFSDELRSWLNKDDSHLMIWMFILLYASIVIFSVVIHFREKAWASTHINIIKDLIKGKS